MAQQLSLTLPVRTARGRDDFFISPANAMALALVENWPNWPSSKLAIIGDAGAGKTHLAHVWAQTSGAAIVTAKDLVHYDIPALASGPVAIEDVPDISEDTAAQKALFHLHNLVLAEGHALLLTGIGEPAHWALGLADLQSRMQGTTVAALQNPDDSLLTALIVKQFQDRQLAPTVDTVPYLVKHMDRSFEAVRDVVRSLDQMSLAEQRPITRAMAKRILDLAHE